MKAKLVHCPACGEDVSANAPTCPKCGHPIKKKKGSCLGTILKLAIFFILVGVGIGFLMDDGSTDTKPKKETVSEVETDAPIEYIEISSTDLIATYNDNQVACKQKYDGQMLSVTGKVISVGTDLVDQTYVCLGSDKEFAIVGVQCYTKDDDVINQIAELKEGDTITVKGKGECGSLTFTMKSISIE